MTDQAVKSNSSLTKWMYPAILLVSFFILYNKVFDEKLDLNGDNAAYFVHGKGIAEGAGYVKYNTLAQRPANHYPIGYPVIIGLTMKVFGDDIVTIKRANGFFLLSFTVLFFFLIKHITKNDLLAFGTALLCLLNSHLLRYSTIIMSEVPYLLFSIVTVYYLIQSDWEQSPFKNRNFWIMLLFLGVTYYIRTAGVALFGGILLFLLFKKKWTYSGVLFGGFAIFPILWKIRGNMAGLEGSSYMKQLLRVNPYRAELGQAGIGDFITRFWNNFERYITVEIPNGIFPFLDRPQIDRESGEMMLEMGDWILGILIIALVLFGLKKLSKYGDLLFFYLLGTFGILMLWPDVWTGPRFLISILPILIFLLFFGLWNLANLGLEKAGSKGQVPAWSLLVFTLFYFKPIGELEEQADANYPAQWKNYFALADYVKQNTNKETTVVACRKPELFYVFANRYTIRYKDTPEVGELIAKLDEQSVTHVAFAPYLGYGSEQRYLAPALQSSPQLFPTVQQFKNPDTWLLKYARN